MSRPYFLLIISYILISGQTTSAVWPSTNDSYFKILALFPDSSNRSTSNSMSVHAEAMVKAAVMLSHEYNLTIAGRRIGWQIGFTNGNVINALSIACYSIASSNVIGIVGPGLSRESHLIASYAKTNGIPVISYSATDPDLSNRVSYSTFFRTVPSDSGAARSIALLFLRFNWTSCIIIYQNDQFGSGGVKAVTQAFASYGMSVKETIEFDIATNTIHGDFRKKLKNTPSRVVIVWAESIFTTLIIRRALADDVLGPSFTWILSENIPLSSFPDSAFSKLIGILTVEPTIGTLVNAPFNSSLLNASYAVWQKYEPESFPGPTRVNNYALFAFDAAWSLILALNQICSRNNSNGSCVEQTGIPYCFDRRLFGSNRMIEAVANAEFLGVSGCIQYGNNVTDRIQGAYYLTQNIQPFSDGLNYVPVLERSDPGDWELFSSSNVILWPGNSLVVPTDRAVLAGVRLRIGVIEVTPFTTVTPAIDQTGQISTRLVGYIPDLIEALQTRMGFIPEIIVAPQNQTYFGLVQAVANGVFDMVAADVTITSKRREIVGFSNTIFDNSLRIMIRKEEASEIDLLSYLRPFSAGLWMMLLGACLYAAFLVCFLERHDNEALHERSLVSQAGMSVWYSIGTVMGYGADFHVQTAAGRLVTVGLYMLSLVFVATYTANLASELTVSKSKDIISGIDDLKSGKIPFSRFGIRLGTAGEDFYLREISGGSRNFFPLTNRADLYEKLLNRMIDASFMDTGVAEYVTNSVYCNLTLVGADFDKSAFGLVIPKQWLYTQDLDVNILALRETGFLDELKRKWFQAGTCVKSTDKPVGMTIEAMSGLFLTFGVISTLSLCFIIFEKRDRIKTRLMRLFGRRKAQVTSATPTKNESKLSF